MKDTLRKVILAPYGKGTGYATFDDSEYGSEVTIYGNALRDGQVFRLSCCCLSPARADLKRRKK